MQIILNGQQHEIAEHTTGLQLIEQLNLANKRFAVEVNQEVVPRSELAQLLLHAGDRVEIVHAIGGG